MFLKAHLLTFTAFLSVASTAPIESHAEERDIIDRQLPGFPSIPSLPFPTNLPGGGGGIPSIPGFPSPTRLPGGGGGFPGLPSSGGGGFPGFPLPTGLPGGSGGSPGFPGFPGGGGGGFGGGSSTENGVTDGGACTPLTVIFARGTGEAGNVGSVAGPPMFTALRQALGQDKVTVQGVNYPASAAVSVYPPIITLLLFQHLCTTHPLPSLLPSPDHPRF